MTVLLQVVMVLLSYSIGGGSSNVSTYWRKIMIMTMIIRIMIIVIIKIVVIIMIMVIMMIKH